LPTQSIGAIRRPKNCIDVYCHSKNLESWLGWAASGGPKHVQQIGIPQWIKHDANLTKLCIKGLFETDGSVYVDRGYTMASFTTIIPGLAYETHTLIQSLGFSPHTYHIRQSKPRHDRYNLRISKNVTAFLAATGIKKD